MITYFDYHSSKPVDQRVIDAMQPYFREHYGNPSSLHMIGDRATRVLEQSRLSVAEFLGAEKDEIIFTSGATESNNLALIGYAMRNRSKGDHIILSEIEHISIHNIAKYLEKQGFSVSRIPVDQYGQVSVKKLAARIQDKTILVSINYANNEIGTLQSIAEIGMLCRERNIVFHSDAVAAQGLVPLDVRRDNIDLMTISSNDMYGPKGTGALFVRSGVKLQPIIIGGGQERGLRSGTENMPGIVGMAKAAEIARQDMAGDVKRLTAYRDTLIKEILQRIPRAYLNGHPVMRLPNNAHFRFDGIEGEALLLSLKDAGHAVSTGSACSSKTLEPSHTLIALGLLHEEAHGSLQLTCGRFTREEEIAKIINDLPEVVQRLRKLSPLYKEED
ncbi:MAG: cysteine desulfurase [candidate division WOR-3 bacterium]|nr:MAG: cysteine desulfurase [candidate division WOR-3 bacterium]